MGKRWRWQEGGGKGDVLRSTALMTATSWSLFIFWLYPHLIGVTRIWIIFFQYGRRTVKRGCQNLIFWEASFNWVVTLLHGKKDISNRYNFTFIDVSNVCVNRRAFKTQSPAIQPSTSACGFAVPGIRNRNAGLWGEPLLLYEFPQRSGRKEAIELRVLHTVNFPRSWMMGLCWGRPTTTHEFVVSRRPSTRFKG